MTQGYETERRSAWVRPDHRKLPFWGAVPRRTLAEEKACTRPFRRESADPGIRNPRTSRMCIVGSTPVYKTGLMVSWGSYNEYRSLIAEILDPETIDIGRNVRWIATAEQVRCPIEHYPDFWRIRADADGQSMEWIEMKRKRDIDADPDLAARLAAIQQWAREHGVAYRVVLDTSHSGTPEVERRFAGREEIVDLGWTDKVDQGHVRLVFDHLRTSENGGDALSVADAVGILPGQARAALLHLTAWNVLPVPKRLPVELHTHFPAIGAS